MQHLVLYTVFHIAIFMSLHGPAGACIPVASASPIHVFPIHALIQNNLRIPQLVGFTHQLGCKKL